MASFASSATTGGAHKHGLDQNLSNHPKVGSSGYQKVLFVVMEIKLLSILHEI